MNKILVFLSILFAFGCAERSNEIFSYGIAENVVTETEPNSELLSGEKHIIESWNLVKKTDKVPKELGIEFGIAYKLNEFIGQDTIIIEESIIFPGNGLTNPGTGITKAVDTEALEIYSQEKQYFSYTLDYPWELKSGVWLFQVRKGGALLLERKFYVE